MREKTTIAIDEDIVRKLTKLLPFLYALIAGAFALGGWVLSLQYRMSEVETRQLVEGVKLSQSQEKIANNDKRITIVETTLESISGDVREIRDDVKQLIRGK